MEKRRFNRLLKKIKRDEKAFDAIYDFYYKRIVYHLSRNYGKELAEDIAHEFFLKLIKNDKEYGQIAKPTSWVYKCCDNLAKTELRKTHCNIAIDESERVVVDLTTETDNEISDVLADLDEVSVKIIHLHYWEGYAFNEIAEILGISYSSVRQRHKRVKQHLKNILEERKIGSKFNLLKVKNEREQRT